MYTVLGVEYKGNPNRMMYISCVVPLGREEGGQRLRTRTLFLVVVVVVVSVVIMQGTVCVWFKGGNI